MAAAVEEEALGVEVEVSSLLSSSESSSQRMSSSALSVVAPMRCQSVSRG